MRWLQVMLVVLVVATAAAFTIQNSTFDARLQLDLGFAAWRLSEPASVPVLMWSAFGVGLLVGVIGMGIRSARASTVRRAESDALAATAQSTSKDPWAGG
jgi:hypothetical protein